jgi:hypothetical protein
VRNRLKPTLTILGHFGVFERSLLMGAVLISVVACNRSEWHEVAKAPNTGNTLSEQQVAPQLAHPLREGDPGFVSTDHLPARTSPQQPPEEAPAHLERNDEIRIVTTPTDGEDGSVEAVVVSTEQPDLVGKHVFVAKKYIADKAVVPSNEENARDKYFMIQNIATERVRVYLNCASKDSSGACVHKMVFETEMTAGENTPDQSRRTILGSYYIEKWHKFYEDHAHYFPSYYAPGYPKLPDAGAELKDWMSPTLLPPKGGVMRGSFGWYTAYIGPNAMDQWTHGTFGKGDDGEKFIRAVKDPSNDLVMDVRSQGCTRVENQAIALMREILPVGTRVVKIYARECYADKELSRYKASTPAKWNWVLTKKLGQDAPKSSAALAKGVGHDEIIDQGTYILDQIPTAIAFNSSDLENGNIYGVKESAMKGVFLVDEGRLAGYEHPAGLKVLGETDHGLPSLMIAKRTDVKPVSVKAIPAKPVPEAVVIPEKH